MEKDIVNSIMQYLKTLDGCFAYKHHGGQYGPAGIPDIICCYKSKFVAFEVKQPNGRVTKLQEIILHKIRDAGGVAYVVYSLNDVKEILESVEGVHKMIYDATGKTKEQVKEELAAMGLGDEDIQIILKHLEEMNTKGGGKDL